MIYWWSGFVYPHTLQTLQPFGKQALIDIMDIVLDNQGLFTSRLEGITSVLMSTTSWMLSTWKGKIIPCIQNWITLPLLWHKIHLKFNFCCMWESINPFPHIDTFWRLCSRRLFKNIVTKEEIAQNEQFLLLPQCFPLLVIGYPFNYRDFLFFDKICSKSSAAELSYEGKG